MNSDQQGKSPDDFASVILSRGETPNREKTPDDFASASYTKSTYSTVYVYGTVGSATLSAYTAMHYGLAAALIVFVGAEILVAMFQLVRWATRALIKRLSRLPE
jgi:hypothetical protein